MTDKFSEDIAKAIRVPPTRREPSELQPAIIGVAVSFLAAMLETKVEGNRNAMT